MPTKLNKEENEMKSKEYALLTISDLVADYLYYDRKEDEELPRGVIEDLYENGELTIKEMVSQFEKELREGLE